MNSLLTEDNLINLLKNKILLKNNKITFPLIQNIEGDKKNVFITFVYIGDKSTRNVLVISPLGNDIINENKMINIKNTNIWYKTYYVRNDIKFRYYFSVNDPLTNIYNMRLKNSCNDKLNNLNLSFDDGYTMSYFVMPNYKKYSYEKTPVITKGNLIKYNIFSKFLNETINISIYTPYNFNYTDHKYGIILFTDGKEHIDLLSANTILDNLIYNKKIDPILGIFIESNINRSKYLKCNNNFEKFIIHEIIPFLKTKFNISENPHKNVIAGFSLGGLMSTYIGLRNSEIFHNILSQSCSYFYNFNYIKKEIRKCNKKLNIYIDVGILENKKIMINPNKKLYSILRKQRFTVKYEEFKSGHDYLSWGEFLAKGLIYLLGI